MSDPWIRRDSLLLALFMQLICLGGQPMLTRASTSQPAVVEMTPKETIITWNKAFADWTIEQAMRTYAFSDEKSARFAKEIAPEVILQEKLQKVVRERWGPDAETKICRICSSDTVDDDAAAIESIHGDFAVVRFKDDVCMPLPMTRIGGEWKLDAGKMVLELGDSLPVAEVNLLKSTVILRRVLADWAAGKFVSADELAKELEKSFDELAPLDLEKKK